LWIVRVALDRPYTFIVSVLMIVTLSGVAITRTPTDIFPNIDIPVVAVDWTYTGLNPEEMEGRLTSPYERQLTKTVDNIQHIESTTLNGQAIVKIFLEHRQCADHGDLAGDPASTPAGYAATADHQLQRVECADPTARPVRQRPVRAATQRPRP
jgi:hypothetical protein